MLAAGRAEFAVAYEKTAEHQFRAHGASFGTRFVPVGIISRTPQYLVFSPRHADSQRLLALFNEGFRKIQRSGEMRRIEQKWSTSAR